MASGSQAINNKFCKQQKGVDKLPRIPGLRSFRTKHSFSTHSMASEVKAALKGAREALEKKDYPTGM